MPPDAETRRHEEAARRQALCDAANQLMLAEPTASQNEIARALGVDAVSLSRYRRKYAAGGYAALLPGISSGAPSLRARLVAAVGAETVAALETKVTARALDMDGSDGAAWRAIARAESTPAPVRAYFERVETAHASKHTIARSLRRATRVTPMMRLAHRGPRALALNGAYTPRYCDVVPGDIFGPDDTTPIWGTYIPVETCQKYPTGYKTMQGQFLPMLDVASQDFVSFALILRETSAYRASDVWRLIGHTHQTVGVPRLGYQMERGSWEAGLIRGVEIVVGEGDFSHTRRVGGLRMLPTNLRPVHLERMNGAGPTHLQTWTSYLPKSKSIEGAFHRLQKFEGCLWGSLGRDQQRKPFEKAKKVFEACKRGAASAPLYFLSLAEMTRKLLAVIDEYRAEPIQGEVFRGRPGEVFERGIAEHGELLPPPVESGYLYRSDWACVTVSRGLVRIRRQNHELGRMVSYFYEAPDLFARQDVDGRSVLVYFDRDAFEAPADIVSTDGKWLGQAHYFQRVGMFCDGDATGHEERKASRDAVTAIYQSVLPHIPSRQVPAEIAGRRLEARSTVAIVDDGRGRSASVETLGGARSVVPAAAAASDPAALPGNRTRGHERPCPSRINDDELLADIARRESELEESGAFYT